MICPWPNCREQMDQLESYYGRKYFACPVHGPENFVEEPVEEGKRMPGAAVAWITLGSLIILLLAFMAWRLM